MESQEAPSQNNVDDGVADPGVVQHLPLIDANEGAAINCSEDSPLFDGDQPDPEEAPVDGDETLDMPPGVESLSQSLFQDAPVHDFSYGGAPLTPILDVPPDVLEYTPPCPQTKTRPTEEEYKLVWDAKLAMHSRSNELPFAFDNLCPRPNHVLWQDCPYVRRVILLR